MIQFKIKISAMLVVIMLLLTSIIATAAEKVSTVDAKELFTAKNFITDEPETVSKDITKQVMEDVSANMANRGLYSIGMRLVTQLKWILLTMRRA